LASQALADDSYTRLRQAKLRALVRDQWGPHTQGAGRVEGRLRGGATLWQPGIGRGWALVDDGSVAGFGAAMAWALRHGIGQLDVLVERGKPAGRRRAGGGGADRGGAMGGRGGGDGSRDGAWAAGVMARRATQFRLAPCVWLVEGHTVGRARPLEFPTPAPVPEEIRRVIDMLSAHGVDPVVEHGAVIGEVLGLEVARVVGRGEVGASGDGVGGGGVGGGGVGGGGVGGGGVGGGDVGGGDVIGVDDGLHLEVGVGRHDREARIELRPGEDSDHALDDVVGLVRRWRAPGARRHPANTLAPERWLRSLVLCHPESVGARRLERRPPIDPVDDLRLPAPAAAAGEGSDGEAIVVVFSIGVDLDLVPTAADHRLLDGRQARLRLVVPEGDDYPVTRQLAEDLVEPAQVVTVPRNWAHHLA
jgi:hypothetical protein